MSPRISRRNRRIKRRNYILRRDGAFCRNCWSREDLTLDHVVPRALGGTNNHANLQILCADCNGAKADELSVPFGDA